MKYFVSLDYQYKCSPIQRVRALVSSIREFKYFLSKYSGDDYVLFSVKLERCI